MGLWEDLFGTGEVSGNKGSDGKGDSSNSHSTFDAPMHGTLASTGQDVTFATGLPGTKDVGGTLMSDGHKGPEFYTDASGNKGHDHYDGKGDGTDRGQYTGPGH